jgi:hypothetical protein
MDVSPVLVADLQAPGAVEPGERPFDHPPVGLRTVFNSSSTPPASSAERFKWRPVPPTSFEFRSACRKRVSDRASPLASSNRWSPLDGESEVGRPRSIDRARPLQFDPSAAEILEESGAGAEQDGDDVDLHLVQ